MLGRMVLGSGRQLGRALACALVSVLTACSGQSVMALGSSSGISGRRWSTESSVGLRRASTMRGSCSVATSSAAVVRLSSGRAMEAAT